MLKSIAKIAAYKKAPVKTFALLHPLRAAKWAAGFFVARTVWRMVSSEKR